MNTYVSSNSSCRSSSRLITWAWIETSSAETGSSATISFGLARARGRRRSAGAARRRTRAGSGSCARGTTRRPRAARCTRWRISRPAAGMVDPQRVLEDRPDPLARIERRVRVLEDHLHVTAKRAKLSLRERRDVVCRRTTIVPFVGRSNLTSSRPASTCRSRTRRPARASRPREPRARHRRPRARGPPPLEQCRPDREVLHQILGPQQDARRRDRRPPSSTGSPRIMRSRPLLHKLGWMVARGLPASAPVRWQASRRPSPIRSAAQDDRAELEAVGASARKPAAGGGHSGDGGSPGIAASRADTAVQPGDRAEQAPGVRMLGIVEDSRARCPARRCCPRTSPRRARRSRRRRPCRA